MPPVTSTTIPTADSICIGGGRIDDAVVRFGKLAGRKGDETFTLGGTLVPPPGTSFIVDPAHRGLQILLEDLGAPNAPILDLTAGGTPIPPGGPGSGCDPADGWRKLTYRNTSGAVDPPLCTPGSAQGLRFVQLKRLKGGDVQFTIRGRAAAIESAIGPLRLTIVLGADASAGQAGQCGVRLFEQRACSARRATFRCR